MRYNFAFDHTFPRTPQALTEIGLDVRNFVLLAEYAIQQAFQFPLRRSNQFPSACEAKRIGRFFQPLVFPFQTRKSPSCLSIFPFFFVVSEEQCIERHIAGIELGGHCGDLFAVKISGYHIGSDFVSTARWEVFEGVLGEVGDWRDIWIFLSRLPFIDALVMHFVHGGYRRGNLDYVKCYVAAIYAAVQKHRVVRLLSGSMRYQQPEL